MFCCGNKVFQVEIWTSLAASSYQRCVQSARLSHCIHRWQALFYKAQLSPPPTNKSGGTLARCAGEAEFSFRLRTSLTELMDIWSKRVHFVIWHTTSRTARRTHGSARCVMSACRAQRGPCAADMCSATTVWWKRWSASTAMGSSETLLFVPYADIWPSSKNKRIRRWLLWGTRMKRRRLRCLFPFPCLTSRAHSAPLRTGNLPASGGFFSVLGGSASDSVDKGWSAPTTTCLRSSL